MKIKEYMMIVAILLLLVLAGLFLADVFIQTPISGWFSIGCASNSSIGGCV